MHQGVQARQTPDGHHADGDSNQGDDHAADDIDEVHLAIMGIGSVKWGWKNSPVVSAPAAAASSGAKGDPTAATRCCC